MQAQLPNANRLRRILIIGLLTIIVTEGFIYTSLHGLDNFRADHRRGREVADSLNKQFQADARFKNVKAIGFSGSGGFFMSSGQFVVFGDVASTNDLVELKQILSSVHPPGTIDNLPVKVRRAPATNP